MSFRNGIFALAILFASLVSPARAADLVLDPASNYLIDATINGQPVRLRVDPAASGYIILNPATVARIGLRRSMTRSMTRIGPVRLTGGSREADVVLGGVQSERRLIWFDQPGIDGADGTVSPAALPYDRVTFRLAEPRTGERLLDFPMQYRPGAGAFFPLQLGDHEVLFKFTLVMAFSMATAGAGAHLSALHGGSWAGDVRSEIVGYGVSRPVRPLRLARPLGLNGLDLTDLVVRTGDHRGALELPPEPDADPDEVVVSAGSRQRALFHVVLGRQLLSACSSLVWDNPARRLAISCAQ